MLKKTSGKVNAEKQSTLDVLEQHHWSDAELQKYYAELDLWRNAVDRERGVRAEEKKAIAPSMLAENEPPAKISKFTGLSVEEIEKLG